MSNSQGSRFLAGAIAIYLSASVATVARAVNIRHDVPDASYQAYGALPQFDATVFLQVPSTDVTGTIVGDGSWLLTAAHPVDGGVAPGDVSFTKNAVTYTGTQIVLHPGWTGNLLSGNDLALVKLNAVVAGVTPAVIYTGSSELTEDGSLIGFGNTGTGAVGSTGGQGTLRGGQNVIDAFVTTSGTVTTTDGANARALFADFDAPDTPVNFLDVEGRDPPSFSGGDEPLALEGMLNVGDSGSPVFIDIGGGVWRIAGVGSGVFSEADLFGGGSPHIDGRFGDYGDAALWTRVSTSSAFILSTIPEPGSATLAAAGGLILAAIRRRARRIQPN